MSRRLRSLIRRTAAICVLAAVSGCTSDLDCQLNGVCEQAKCRCDAAWTGDDCGTLQLKPGKLAYAPDDATAWGGGPPVKDEATGKWILFVTEIANHCGLSEWQHMSTVVRATGASPAGPFTRQALVIPPQAHNPYYTFDPASKTHLIYHIGGGDNPESKTNPFYHNCSNGTTPGPAALSEATEFSAKPYIHASKSLQGPFERVNVTSPPGSPLSWGSDNPAPYIFPNGTVLMLTRKYNGTRAKAHQEPHDTIWLVRAPSFDGPYEFVFDRPVFAGESFNEEDPCQWRDARGNFHALFHFTHGHAWSQDGITWHWNGGKAAYECSLALPNGTVIPLRDAERPRVWVNPKTMQPELLFVASGGQSQPTKRGLGEKGFLVVQQIATE